MLFLALLIVCVFWVTYFVWFDGPQSVDHIFALEGLKKPFRKLRWWITITIKPRNKVHISTLTNSWWDRDYLLLHAMFQILVDFIEEENPFEIIDFEYSDEHKRAKKELQELYTWWKEVRPKREDGLTIKEVVAKEDAWYIEDTKMMSRLVKIREWLWT